MLFIKHTVLWCAEVTAENLLLSWQKSYEKFILGQIFKDSAKIGTENFPSIRKFKSSTTNHKKWGKKLQWDTSCDLRTCRAMGLDSLLVKGNSKIILFCFYKSEKNPPHIFKLVLVVLGFFSH